MATKSQIRNAQRRIDRFIIEHGDELLRLRQTRQSEILEDVYQGRGKLARVKLRMYVRELHASRSEASKKAASTSKRRRQIRIGERVTQIFANSSSERVLKNVQLLTSDQIRQVDAMTDNQFETFWITNASQASKLGATLSPFFYR